MDEGVRLRRQINRVLSQHAARCAVGVGRYTIPTIAVRIAQELERLDDGLAYERLMHIASQGGAWGEVAEEMARQAEVM